MAVDVVYGVVCKDNSKVGGCSSCGVTGMVVCGDIGCGCGG